MHQRRGTLAALIVLALLIGSARAGRAEVILIGAASIPGDATDLSGLTDSLEDGAPHNRLGSFGSAIDYTGHGNRYITAADRGPNNGEDRYKTRLQTFDIEIKPGDPTPVNVTLVATTLLTNEKGQNLVGLASEFTRDNGPGGLRLDPEGIRVSRAGTLFISDEYGPFIAEFDMKGRRLRNLPVPQEFSVKHPHANPKKEISKNTRGRVTNHGLEGLALSPDGKRLYALLQGPLIQDNGKDGANCRMLEVDIATGRTRQFLTPLTQRGNNFNELLAVNDHEFLAIERDGFSGNDAHFKKIVLLDIAGASDINSVNELPDAGAPRGIVAVFNHPFIDLLDPRFGLVGAEFPEKVEGLAFGPNLPDGRRVLIVTTDNDFIRSASSWFWVFALSPDELAAPLLHSSSVSSK